MSQGRLAANSNSTPRDPLARLFAGSSLVGWTDGELLARFVATRDELAFEGLVVRLGPMVLGVCRRMLGGRGEVDDAFQATFLVLIRRAGAVGRGDLIGPWLHGVAVRVCRQARARQTRRWARERTVVAVEESIDQAAGSAESRVDQAETRASIDDAIARLPEGYRRVVILCDVEGLSRDEAADRLGWTANMVRGRLARARSQLRARLVQRGCVPPGLTVEAGSGLGLGLWVGKLAPSPVLVATTARVALLFDSPKGRQAAATLAATSALPLASGVLRMMFYSSWKIVGSSLLLGGSLVGGAAGVLLAQGPAAPQPVATQPRQPPQARPLGEGKPSDDAGQAMSHAQFIAAEKRMNSELAQARTPAERQALLKAFEGLVKRYQEDLVQKVAAGQASRNQVAEATEALRTVAVLLTREVMGVEASRIASPAGASLQTLLKERLGKARDRQALQAAFYEEGRITIDRTIAANRQVMEAELDLAATADQRRVIVQHYVDQVTQIHNRETKELEVRRATTADVAEAAERLLEARIMLARESGAFPAQPASEDRPDPRLADLDRRLTEVERKLDRVLETLARVSGTSPKEGGAR